MRSACEFGPTEWPAQKETIEVRSGGSWPGAVEQNRGPHLTSALLSQRIERCTVYRFRPGPPAESPPHLPPSAAPSPSVPGCGPRLEKFRPHPSHLGSALVSTEWPAQKETIEVRSGGSWPGAVEQNRGPHLIAVLLRQHSERCTVYRFRPGPPAGPPSHFPSAASSPSAPACGRRVERFRPHPSHLGSALVPTE
jgi:hypothetical protein